LVIAVSENLRTELFGDAFPRVDEASNATAVQSEESEESARSPEGRLIVEYAHAGAYYGVEKEASKDASEDASTIDPGKTKNQKKTRGSLCVATVAIGGVDTNAPFAVSSLWLDASPAAADAAARHAETRVRDAERALANVKAKLIRTETFVAELEHELVPLRARCEAAERREKTLAESARASLAESKTRAREAERFESEARRAVDVADAARARARLWTPRATRRSAGSPRLCATSACAWSKKRGRCVWRAPPSDENEPLRWKPRRTRLPR
jgi:hypothetical protein